ncbi:Hypothetical predicted protein [Olea europaea subsp. europaea]|uniref:Uncharacterized protein n=1 Tax=Olea europaea subsp. europaea TaxID=158383 RepID=A0A8S0UE40_OLEEU|nr:Hypothetical predicted protein [Olea europaea subsp. europaea]
MPLKNGGCYIQEYFWTRISGHAVAGNSFPQFSAALPVKCRGSWSPRIGFILTVIKKGFFAGVDGTLYSWHLKWDQRKVEQNSVREKIRR